MKSLEKLFFKMSGREQFLLVISLWVVFAVALINVLQSFTSAKNNWALADDEIRGHQIILNLKPSIDAALEKQKNDQKNISYDLNQLSTLADRLAVQVFPQRDSRNLKSEENKDSRYIQHRVRIKFEQASYEDVNEYAALIRQESPYMFLSDVEIEPKYPSKTRPYDPTKFNATFEVSSVEFLNP